MGELLRRCAVLWLEPREVPDFDLAGLLRGGTGVTGTLGWFAHAPHLDLPVEVDAAEVLLLGRASPHEWRDSATWGEAGDTGSIVRLRKVGLLIGKHDEGPFADADARLRAVGWHAAAALQHGASRWSTATSRQGLEGPTDPLELRRLHGVPPPVVATRGDAGAAMALPEVPRSELDGLLESRRTCRNFDAARPLPLEAFSRLLHRVFAAQACVPAAPDFSVMTRSSPSGGALHPTEAYLLVRNVSGVAPGLYHYHPLQHAILPLDAAALAGDLDTLARAMVCDQDYFVDAHVLVALAPRFARNFWKYRNHAKAYRVCILDVGHLSQTLLLSATEQGLGAFITAAINEADIEEAFGLTGYVDGPLAVCGFGIPA